MKGLYRGRYLIAVYDKDGYIVTTATDYRELAKSLGMSEQGIISHIKRDSGKLRGRFRVELIDALEEHNDVFAEEDEIFLKHTENTRRLTDSECAKRFGCNFRTFERHAKAGTLVRLERKYRANEDIEKNGSYFLAEKGLKKSILQDYDECYNCGSTRDLQIFFAYPAKAKRKICRKNGFWVRVCPYCAGWLNDWDFEDYVWKKKLKEDCQRKFESLGHSREEFIELIGKSYLIEELTEDIVKDGAHKLITYKGETHNIKEWAKIKGIRYATLLNRLRTGWTFEKAIGEKKGEDYEIKSNIG